MELGEAIDRRRMVRNYQRRPLAPGRIDELLDRARRAPSAGNTGAVRFVVLDRPAAVEAYWDTTLPAGPRRDRFGWPGLLLAPCLVLVATEPERYLRRYAEPDKAATGRGDGFDRWPVPYWWVDAGAAIQNLLLLVVQDGLGACLFGPFDHEPALRDRFGLDAGMRLVATIAIGHPAPDRPGRSEGRARPTLDEIVIRPEV